MNAGPAQEAGSIVNSQQMGSPTGGGGGAAAVPAQAPTINMPGSGPTPATNQQALSGDLRKVTASSPVSSGPVAAAPVPDSREGVDEQRRVQSERVATKVQSERAAAETTNQRSNATTATVRQMRETHSVQEQIRDATQDSAKLLEEIRNILNGQGSGDSPSAPQQNVQDQREQMMLKNASTNPPVGTKQSGSRPFSTARKSA